MYLKILQQRLGYVPRRKGHSVLMLVNNDIALASIGPIVKELGACYPRLNIFLVACNPGLCARFTGERGVKSLLPGPFHTALTIRKYLAQSKACLILLSGDWQNVDLHFIKHAAEAGIAIAVLDASEAMGDWLSIVDLLFVRDKVQADRLESLGVGSEHIHRLRAVDKQTMRTEIVEALKPLIIQRKPTTRVEGHSLRALLSRNLLHRLLSHKYHCIPTIEGLSEALGWPATIICLGNGPSSEDSRLKELDYDVLFRVNHSWLKRGFMTDAQVVFTGSKSTVRRLKGPVIFCFQTRKAEERMLLKCFIRLGKMIYTTAERLGTVDFGSFSIFEPTNGAVMLATAVALRPKRLIIAGMDLFNHTAGSYPGDTTTPNVYTPSHDRDTELNFILATLEQYNGELIILSEVLEMEWRTHLARKRIETSGARESHEYRSASVKVGTGD